MSVGTRILNLCRARLILTSAHYCEPGAALALRHRDYGPQMSSKSAINMIDKRNIYNQYSLDMYKLKYLTKTKLEQLGSEKDNYIKRIQKYVDGGDFSSILRDDFISLIGLAENEQHIELLEKILEVKSSDPMMDRAALGSMMIRVYYKLNLVDRAYNIIKDTQKFANFFDQLTSYKIVMTMLFDNGRYEQVLEFYDLAQVKLKPIENSKFPNLQPLFIIVYAALAKINTPEALERAKKLHLSNGPQNSLRSIKFLALLALRQEQPKLALDFISELPFRTYLSIQTIKALALIKIKRFDDVLVYLHHILESRDKVQQSVLKLVADEIRQVQDQMDEEIRNEMLNTLSEIEASDMVIDEPLDKIVFTAVRKRPFDNQPVRPDQIRPQRSFDRARPPQRSFDGARPPHRSGDYQGGWRPPRYNRMKFDLTEDDERETNRV